MENAEDPYMALLSYRATPLPWCHHSPAELLIERKIWTDVPQVKQQFMLKWTYLKGFRALDSAHKESQEQQYNQQRKVWSLPLLPDNTPVWVTTGGRHIPGTNAVCGGPKIVHH